jgi:release factor glutamine methyltransferase
MTEGEALVEAATRLAAAGIAAPRHEARLLLALSLAVPAERFVPSSARLMAEESRDGLALLVERRARHEPYARIAGRREFWSLEFALGPETLEPRPDSETLIETALGLVADRAAPLEIIDFGTGSGALLLALLSELPRAAGVGVDLLHGAVAVARRNAVALGLGSRARFMVGSWGDGLRHEAHLILANPPYIPSAQIAALAPEVTRYDPPSALDGGPDGLRAFRDLAEPVTRLLAPSGVAVFEIGDGQAESVDAIMARAGLEAVTKRCDLAGIVRCIAFVKRKSTNKSMKHAKMK